MKVNKADILGNIKTQIKGDEDEYKELCSGLARYIYHTDKVGIYEVRRRVSEIESYYIAITYNKYFLENIENGPDVVSEEFARESYLKAIDKGSKRLLEEKEEVDRLNKIDEDSI